MDTEKAKRLAASDQLANDIARDVNKRIQEECAALDPRARIYVPVLVLDSLLAHYLHAFSGPGAETALAKKRMIDLLMHTLVTR